MKKIITLSIVAIFVMSLVVFAEFRPSYKINSNQPLSPGDEIYGTGFLTEEGGGVALFVHYRGVEAGKIAVQFAEDLSYKRRRLYETKTLLLPLDGNNQAYLNKGDARSTLLLTVIDGQNHITVEETNYRGDVPLTQEANNQILKSLMEKIEEANKKKELIAKIHNASLKTSLTSPSLKYKLGEPIYLKLELKNTGKDTIHYDDQQIDLNGPLIVTGPQGEMIYDSMPSISTMGGDKSIEPGQTVVLFDKFDLLANYKVVRPGIYKIQHKGHEGIFNDSLETPDNADIPPSNTITIEILP